MIKKYPDGSSYAQITKFDKEFVFRINSYEDLWNLKQITDVYSHNGLRPIITIPNLIDAQADRRFSRIESFNLKLVCEFLNNMYADFKIFHPHNSEVVEALINNVQIIDNTKFISLVLENIVNEKFGVQWDKFQKDSVLNNLILMSSDAGGFKPLMKLCNNLDWQGETFSASKSRRFENNQSSLIQQVNREDFQGKDILIVDDICVYGGTFKGLSKLLKERNCGKLYLAVSHMTVQNLGQEPVTNYFDKVFCTNSKYNEYFADGKAQNPNIDNKLTIIKLF